MSMFDALNISASGLSAERIRMDVVSANLANANTTRTLDGGPYRRREALFSEVAGEFGGGVVNGSNSGVGGVRVASVVQDQSPLRMVFDPGHPDADANGYVALPNVNVVTEMVDMISASRAYEANATAFQSAKQMAMRALELGR